MDCEGKVAIISGGATGIGKAFATSLLENGMKVCICDVNEVTAKTFMASLPDKYVNKIIFQKCDVSSYEEFKSVFEKTISTFGRIDVVANNAGICNESDYRRMIDINFVGVVHGINLGLQYMDKSKGGNGGDIINVSSLAGIYGSSNHPVYGGTKFAVVGLTKGYGTPTFFIENGVRMNVICPGPTVTDLFFEVYPERKGDNTVARPKELANCLLHILKHKKNGAIVTVDEMTKEVICLDVKISNSSL